MQRSTLWVARIGIGTALLVLLLGSFVLFQYTTAVSLEGVFPEEKATLKDGKVTIHAGIPGLDPDKGDVRVLLNGRPVPDEDLEFVGAGGVRISRHLSDGLHEVKVDVRTSNIFARHLTHSWSFTVDTKAPVLSDLQPAPDAALSEKLTAFRASFDEAVEGVLTVDGKEVLRENATLLLGSLDLTEGSHELSLEARDKAGNIAVNQWKVLVDASAPTFTMDVNPEGTWTNGRSHIHLQVNDAHSGVVQVAALADGKSLTIGGGETLQNASSAGGTSWSYDIDTSGLGEGEHSFALTVQDQAGNKAEWNSTFSIDLRKIRIDLSERRLYHYASGASVKEYPVAVGLPQYPTPQGTFKIVIREKDPTWNPPPSPWAEGFEPVPPGPGNPLGTRWIGLSAYAIGIHGTYERNSIGRAASHGCIRMYIEDVEELFELVEVGMPVEIVR